MSWTILLPIMISFAYRYVVSVGDLPLTRGIYSVELVKNVNSGYADANKLHPEPTSTGFDPHGDE